MKILLAKQLPFLFDLVIVVISHCDLKEVFYQSQWCSFSSTVTKKSPIGEFHMIVSRVDIVDIDSHLKCEVKECSNLVRNVKY